MKRKTKKNIIKLLFLMLISVSVAFAACSSTATEETVKDVFHVYSTSIVLEKGEEFQIEVDTEVDAELQFTSSNTAVAVVSNDGVVHGVKEGIAVVQITSGENIANCKVTVTPSSYVMSIGYEELSLTVGSSKQFIATIQGGEQGDVAWTIDNEDGATITKNASNTATFVASKTGVYVLTATCGNLVSQCTITVIALNAVRLSKPELSITDCKTLTWVAVNDAVAYAVSVDGYTWEEVAACTKDVSNITDNLKNGEKATFYVKSLAKGSAEFFDSYITSIEFAHDYNGVYTEGKEATCTQLGEINFTCNDCSKQYTDSKYLAEHNYVSWQCTECKGYRTSVVYAYDDNYIPIPTDEEASDENSEWRIKYYDYYKDDVTSYSSKELWMAVDKNKDQIPVEDRTPCYYVNAAGDHSAKEIYVAGYWYNPDCNPEPLPVKYVGMAAFTYNTVIDKMVFSKETTEFRGCVFDNSRIKKVIAPGLTYLNYYHVNTHMFAQIANFRNCFSLDTIVVGESLIAKGLQFYWWDFKHIWPEGHEAKINLYFDREYNDMEGFKIDLNNGGQLYQNDLLTGKYYFKDSTGQTCNTWRYNEDGTDIIFNGHVFINGKCAKCDAHDDKGINYLYDSEKDCYYVGVGAYSGKVVIAEYYNDGIHGTKTVSYVDPYAFYNSRKGSHRSGVTHLYLPKTITEIGSFQLSLDLQVLSIPGVKVVDEINSFLDCYKLHTLIIGDSFSAKIQSFYVRNDNPNVPYAVGYEPLMTIYTTNPESASIKFAASVDNMWNGKLFTYDEGAKKCNSWCWGEDNSIIVGNVHEYVDGNCKYCGHQDAHGFTYLYDSASDSYYLHDASVATGVVKVFETYNDGVHGIKPVTRIGHSAFSSNKNITHVYLPESVTKVGVFESCYGLKLVSMPGVQVIDVINTFLDCYRLETLVIGSSLETKQQCFLVRNDEPKILPHLYGYEANTLLTIYTVKEAASVNIVSPKDNMWNGTIVNYCEGATKCGTWCWEDSEQTIIKRNTNVHDYDSITGICKVQGCGAYNTYGVIYTLNEDGESYSVTAYDSSASIVKVYAEYQGKPVTAIKNNAFKAQSALHELYLPATITEMPNISSNNNIRVLSMPGVTQVNQRGETNNNLALDCASLEILIVGKTFKSDGQVFYDRYYGGNNMTVYTTATSGANIQFTGVNNRWNGEVVYYSENPDMCGSWSWADATQMGTKVNSNKHNYNEITDICSVCGDTLTYGLAYTLNEQGDAYSVTSYDGLTAVVKVHAEYKGKPVTSITGNVFSGKSALKELYLPTTITVMPKLEVCSGLEVLSMPGVTSANQNDGYGNYALDTKLKTLIVGSSFVSDGQVFYDRFNGGNNMTVYTTATSGANIKFTGTNNNRWNGTIVYYSETEQVCGTWKWANAKQMQITASEKTAHAYNVTTGICSGCNQFNSCGLTYTLNEGGESYSVTAYDGVTTVVKVYETYNNKPVTSITGKIFSGKSALKELYLPTTITQMPDVSGSGIQILSMPGVTEVNQRGETNNNLALDCGYLKILIVGKTFKSDGQVFYDRHNGGNNMTVYTTATTDANISFTGTNNNRWNGIIIYYDAELSAPNTWRWAADGTVEVYQAQ